MTRRSARREVSSGAGPLQQRGLLSGQSSQRFQASYEGDEWQAFERSNRANRASFSAFLRLHDGAILSLSPERFIQLENGHIQTRPIVAGRFHVHLIPRRIVSAGRNRLIQ